LVVFTSFFKKKKAPNESVPLKKIAFEAVFGRITSRAINKEIYSMSALKINPTTPQKGCGHDRV